MAARVKRIGIITRAAKLFDSGIGQNALFLYMVFQNLGYPVDMFSVQASFTKLDYKEIPVQTFSSAVNFALYDAIITVGAGLLPEEYSLCKKHRVRVIGYLCGNAFMMNLQDFVSPTKATTIVGKQSPLDTMWLLNAFAYMKTYVQLMRGVPVSLVPHVWSPILLEDYVQTTLKKPPTALSYTPDTHTSSKINLIILEPNIQFLKTALLPLVASEKVFLRNAELIDTVYIFNYPENENAERILKNLNVSKHVRVFKQMHICEILLYFNSIPGIPIVVSHQMYTHLNYLYYELLYYGFPLVHNSTMLKEFGYYYKDCDVDTCADQIIRASRTHATAASAETLAKNRAYLAPLHPDSASCQREWAERLQTATTRP